MRQIKITSEGPIMTEKTDLQQAFLVTITDEQLAEASGDDLREMANRGDVASYSRKTTIFTVELTPAVASTPGALTAIDKVLAVLRTAYAGRDPEVVNRYGGSLDLVVWQTDDALRDMIKFARDRAVTAAAEQDAEEE
jgi:hypothetical protein